MVICFVLHSCIFHAIPLINSQVHVSGSSLFAIDGYVVVCDLFGLIMLNWAVIGGESWWGNLELSL